MKEIEKNDLIFIASSASNISGIPARIYEGGKLIFSNASLFLLNDPFSFENVKIPSDEIGFFTANFKCNYGYINQGIFGIVFGPTREVPFTKKETDALATELEISTADYSRFVDGLKTLGSIAPYELMQVLTLVFFSATGKKLSATDVFVNQHTQTEMTKIIHATEAESQIDWSKDVVAHSKTYIAEKILVESVQNGDTDSFNRFVSSFPALKSGKMAEGQIRQAKNTFISAVTVVSRAAIDGGLDTDEAMELSAIYVSQCEQLNDVVAITNLQFKMIVDYINRVKDAKEQTTPKIMRDVALYVRKNLSNPITTQEIADYLYLSRPYLSATFKQQAGIPLSEYIAKAKIEEACRILLYTKKTVFEISEGLGFSSQSHFTNTFKKYKGCTPKQIRKEPR